MDGSKETQSGTQPRPTRENLNKALLSLYRPYLTQFPQVNFSDLMLDRYGVGETRLMTIEQLADLIGFIENKLMLVTS